MRRSLTVAVMAAATLLAGGATATASETPSPSTESNASSAPDSTTPLERVRAYTEPSIVYVMTEYTGYVYDTYNKMYLNKSKPVTFTGGCTGFVVNPDGYIGTAGHCVNVPEVGEPSLYEAAAQWAINTGYYVDKTLTVDDIVGFNDFVIMDQGGRRTKPTMSVSVTWAESAGGVETSKGLPARVVKWQKFAQGDGAVLKVEESNLNALPLTEEQLEVGTEVISVGYPGSIDTLVDADLTPSFKEGSVSSQKTMSGGLTSVWEISAPMSKGMSGGPTVDLNGGVVGINSFGPEANFDFIQPVSVIRELLSDAGSENVLSEDTQAYRAGLDALFAGDKEAAVENLETVVDNQPTNQLAKEFLDQAQELPDPPAEDTGDDNSGGSNMGMIIGIVVGVVVLLAILGAVLLAMSRKKKGGSSASGGHAYGGPPAPGYQGYQQPGGTGLTPGATSTAVLTPTALQPGPSAAAPSQAPFTPPPAPAPAPAAAAPAPAAAAPAPVAPAPAPAAAPAPEVVDETVFCQNCGTKGDPGQKFCKHCGTAL